MNKYFFLLLTFLSLEAFGAPKITLKFTDPKVKQGSLVDAVINLNSETTQKIQYGQLKGQTLGGSFYIYQAKPLMTKGNWETLESDAKVIVVKIPENKPLIHKLGDDSIEIDWDDVEFLPTEVPKDFIFGNFEVPARKDLFKWLIIILVIVGLSLGGFRAYKVYKTKSDSKKKKLSLKSEVTGAKSYEDVVNLWKKKLLYTKEFPHLEEHFRKLEAVLFRYQFKPSQTETEKVIVMNAYKEFIKDSEGGFRGI